MYIKPGTKVRFKSESTPYGEGVVKSWIYPQNSWIYPQNSCHPDNGFWSIDFDRSNWEHGERLWLTPNQCREQLIIVDESSQIDIKPGTKVKFKSDQICNAFNYKSYGEGVVMSWVDCKRLANSDKGFYSINFDRVDTGNEENLWFTPDEFKEQLIIVDESQQMKITPDTTFTLIQTYSDTSQMKTDYKSLEQLLVFLLSSADKGLITKVRDEIIPGLIPENKIDDTSLINSSQGRNLQRLYKNYLQMPYPSVWQLFDREYDLASSELKRVIEQWIKTVDNPHYLGNRYDHSNTSLNSNLMNTPTGQFLTSLYMEYQTTQSQNVWEAFIWNYKWAKPELQAEVDKFCVSQRFPSDNSISNESVSKTVYVVLGWDINTQQCETLSGVYDSIEDARSAAKEASNEYIHQHFQAIPIQLNDDIDLDISSHF